MPYVSDFLTAAAASVTGTPTPTRSWQWLRGSTLISGATSSTYTVAQDDIGSAISVRQIETNIAGVDTATSAATAAVQAFEPIALFQNSEEGAWYDPSDLSTLYQDSAGTTPVTAAGQPVGLMLDKSKGLVLGDENLTESNAVEDDTDATTGWTQSGGSLVSQASETNESSFAFYLSVSGTAAGRAYRSMPSLTAGRSYKITIDAKNDGTGESMGVYIGSTSSAADIPIAVVQNTDTSWATYSAIFIASASTSYIIIREASVSNTGGIYVDNISIRELPGNHATQSTSTARPTLQVTGTTPATLGSELVDTANDATEWVPFASNTVEQDGDAVKITFVADNKGARVLLTQAAGLTQDLLTTNSYQLTFEAKINTGAASVVTVSIGEGQTLALSTSYQTFTVQGPKGSGSNPYIQFSGLSAGEIAHIKNISVKEVLTWADPKYYLDFDGVDDALATASIDFTATDQMSVFAGVEKQSDVSAQTIAELSASIVTNAGSWYLVAGPDGGGNKYTSSARGAAGASSAQRASTSLGAAPDTAVLTATHDIPGDLSTIRRNAVAGTDGIGDKGAGNFGNYPLYIAARGGTSLEFDGRIYGLIVRGASSTTAEIEATESYLATKAGVTLP